MMVTFKLTKENSALTENEKKMLEKARKMPVLYDEDSPKLTEEMEKAFIAARRKKKAR